jgi:hypothetical protein
MEEQLHDARSSMTAFAAPRTARSRMPVVVLYSATLVLSAALVFMVQPMFARFVLPLLGGTPAVWTTAMLFFQTILLLAYLYAHWTTRRFGPRRQAALHLALVFAALIVLPLGVPDGWTPPLESSPIPWLLLLLLVAVGLPFFVVSSTAPLLQSWLADTDHPDGRDPYFLYRASNIGSVIGLLSYPLLVERALTLDEQSWMWTAGYSVLATLLTASALAMWRSRRPEPEPSSVERTEPRERIGIGRRVRWVAFAFVPSSLMLGATSAMTTNLAPIPLLWVAPLSLYLVSFILVFSRGEGAGPFHRLALYAMPPLAVLLAGVVTIGFYEPLWPIIALHLVAFFVIALAMHGELAADRPAASQLTQFFAWVSLGGALGGVFNVIVAPSVFNSLTEYPIVLVLACFLLPMRSGSWRDELSIRKHLAAPIAAGGLGGALLVLSEGHTWTHRAVLIAMGVACVAMYRNPLRFGLAVALAMVAVWAPSLDDSNVIYQDRSFFGINRVEETPDGILHELKNGNIVHGSQVGGVGIDPSTYYHRTGPMGQLLEALPDRSLLGQTAVVGLGAGSMACLSQSGERWTFFEIDPAVVKLASDPELFSYLRDCDGELEVQVGDGRMLLKRQANSKYGLIALDAFSSDAIPVHLLTRQAAELYESRLRPRGVLAFHISNKYLALEPVLGNVSRAAGLACYAQADRKVGRRFLGKYPSHWVAMARSERDLGGVPGDARWHRCSSERGARVWTDDYANVIGAFR